MASERRTIIRTLLFFVAALLSVEAGFSASPQSSASIGKARATTPPNVILMMADDLGIGDVGCYGHSEIPTPHLDSIAAQGVRMTQFYSSAPVCTPSRFSLLTGMLPNRSRDRLLDALYYADENDLKRGLHHGEEILAQRLKSKGYATALIGKWHLGHGKAFLPIYHGFDYFLGHTGGAIDFWTHRWGYIPDWYRNDELIEQKGYTTDLIADEAVSWIQANSRKPFFLYIPFNAPHVARGWDPKKKDPRLESRVPDEREFVTELQAPEEAIAKFRWIKDPKRRVYAAMVSRMDDAVGRILQAVQQSGLAPVTLIAFLSDNGGDPGWGGSSKPFRGGKTHYWEGGIRVPCLMRLPGHIPAGSISHQVAANLDIAPTVATLAGLSVPAQPVDGVDIGPSLFQGRWIERELFFWNGKNAGAFRSGRWKLVEMPLVAGQPAETGLYDLETDALESRDFASVYPARLKELQAKYAQVKQKLASLPAAR